MSTSFDPISVTKALASLAEPGKVIVIGKASRPLNERQLLLKRPGLLRLQGNSRGDCVIPVPTTFLLIENAAQINNPSERD